MNKRDYIVQALTQKVKVKLPTKNSYLHQYRFLCMKRFLILTLMIFIFQYLSIMSMDFSFPVLPLYPSIGISVVLFYLFGVQAIVGLLLAGIIGYFLKGFSFETQWLYLLADIGCGYLGATLSLRVLSSDIKPFQYWQESLKFIAINTLVCALSAGLRTFSLLNLNRNLSRNMNEIIIYELDFLFSDLNAIVALSVFLLSFVYIPFSREKMDIKKGKIPLIIVIVLFASFLLLIVSKKSVAIYPVLLLMAVSLFWLYNWVYKRRYLDYYLHTLTIFMASVAYLCYFIGFKYYYIHSFGIIGYVFVPVLLFLYILISVYLLGNR